MIPLLYHLFDVTEKLGNPARLLQYTTVRAIGAFLLAFAIVFCLAPRVIVALFRKGLRDKVRDYGEVFSQSKSGTPTMGGLLVIAGVVVSGMVFCDLQSRFVPIVILTTLWFGFAGFLDDYLKIRRGGSDRGLSRSTKLVMQIGFSAFFATLVLSEGSSPLPAEVRRRLFIPFLSKVVYDPSGVGAFSGMPDLGIFAFPFIVLAMSSIANAINFADGLDGLAIVPASFTVAVYGLFAYLVGHEVYCKYLMLPSLEGANELTVYASALAGAGIGFVWYNTYPAQVFMGDTGAQAIGGTIAALAILTKQEILFLIAGAVFVFEFLSVFIQDRIGIARLGRRFYFRTPIHHSFQYHGVAEPKVVVRFWIAAAIAAFLSAATLKLR